VAKKKGFKILKPDVCSLERKPKGDRLLDQAWSKRPGAKDIKLFTAVILFLPGKSFQPNVFARKPGHYPVGSSLR